MGRPERHLEPDGRPSTELAIALRELRVSAGAPSYREMATRALRSQTALSEAAGGSLVPTWDTAESYARACGASVAQISRLRVLWEAARAASPVSPGGSPAPEPADPEPVEQPIDMSEPEPAVALARVPKRPGLRVVAGCAAVGLVALAGLGWVLLRPGPAAPASSVRAAAGAGGATGVTSKAAAEKPFAPQNVVDGADPKDSGCALDPGVITLEAVEVDWAGKPAGLGQLRYSPQCGVAWPRFEAFPQASIPTGTQVHVDVIRPRDHNLRKSFDAGYVGAPVYGNVLTSTSSCVYAAVRLEGPGSTMPDSRTHCFLGRTAVQSAT